MKLFWKVFFTLILTLLATFAVATWLSQKWLEENKVIEPRIQALFNLGETAVALYQQGDKEHLQRWLKLAMKKHHFRGALLDQKGHNVLSYPLTAKLKRLAKKIINQKQVIHTLRPPHLLTATPFIINNTDYYWVAATRLAPNQMHNGRQGMLFIRLGITLLALIMISWWLTRMFTHPVRQLQESTEQLGQGKLSVRTAPELAKRKDELGDLSCSFDAMAEQLESLIHSHQQLLRDISHELRSPLARLQVALELARNEAGEKANAELDRIDKEATQLNTLIGEVLTLARFEQGAVQENISIIALNELLSQVANDAAFEAESMGKKVSYHPYPACQIKADQRWITRALDNIVRNAIHHTKLASSVDISLTIQAQQIIIRIRDHGDGVEVSALPHLFEPFFRASDARERHAQQDSGYGLGLAIAQRVVEQHGGHIQARNHPEGGLEVNIYLRLHNAKKTT